MKNWKVDYAYRKDGKYFEGTMTVTAVSITAAIGSVEVALFTKAYEGDWDWKEGRRFVIWNAGIVADADEEVF